MRKHYIIPSTTSVALRTDHVCQALVNSVHGNLNLHFIPGTDEDPI